MSQHSNPSSGASEAEGSVATLADFRILNLNKAQSNVAVLCYCNPPLPALPSDNDEGNPNRSRFFYTCPREEQRCSFFQWGDAPNTPAAPKTPSSTHAIIRALPKSRYDSLIKDNPDAALSYMDEDDGEQITVGSGYELEQRLRDPINPATAPKPAPGASTIFPDDVQLLHNFDLNSHDDKTVQLWQSLQSPWPNVCSHDAPASVWARRRTLTELASGGSSDSANAFPEQPSSVASVEEDKQKPLLDLFESELAKLVPGQDKASSMSAARRGKKRVAFEPEPESIPEAGLSEHAEADETPVQEQQRPAPDPETSVPRSSSQQQRRAGEAFVSGLQTFISGVGSFAARVDEANPQLREQLSHAQAAGQEAAYNFLTRLLPEIQTRAAAAGVKVDLSRMPSSRGRAPPSSSSSSASGRLSASSSTSTTRNRTYEAERILATRYICYDNLNAGGPKYRQYLVRWAGCGPGDDVWYDEDNLKTSCQPLIDQFERGCGSSCLSPLDAAHIHRRTAANRMVASMIPRGVIIPLETTSASSPAQDARHQPAEAAPMTYQSFNEPPDFRSPPPEAFLRQPAPRASATVCSYVVPEPQQASIETVSGPSDAEHDAEPSQEADLLTQEPPAPQSSYKSDPADVLAQENGESTLRRVRSVLPMQAAARMSEDAGHWPRLGGEHRHLRRAKSLAFRDRSHHHDRAALEHLRRLADGPASSDNLPRPKGPTLRRAATLDHKRSARPDSATESLNNTFEAARLRYLSRRAATAVPSVSSEDGQDDKVVRCTNHLVSMGYRRAEAEPVAAICEGDLSKALDQLEEDRKAWLWRSSHGGADSGSRQGDGAGAPNIPGSWDVYRW